MAGSNVQVEVVFDHFPRIIKGMHAKADQIVRKTALDIQEGAQVRAPVDTGTLRASIQAKRIGDLHWEVWVGVDYGIYLEYGTVNMAARPYMRPAVNAVIGSFKAAMKGVVKP
jgi:HK97 gp10 family phage protein